MNIIVLILLIAGLKIASIRLIKSGGVLGFFLLFPLVTNAEILRSSHETIRSLGTGGVRIVEPNMGHSHAWNPAYLGYNSGLNLTLFDAGLGLNGQQAYNNFSEVNWSAGLSAWNDIYGKPLWLGGSALMGVALGNIGLAYNKTYDLTVLLTDPILPILNANYYEDEYYVLGWGTKLENGLAVGVNLKKINRIGGNISIGTTTLTDPAFTNDFQNNLINQFTAYGSGYGADLGLSYKWDMPFNPQVGLSWQDVGHTTLTPSDPSNPVTGLNENMILTASFFQDYFLAGLAGGIEYRHIRNNEEQIGKKIHVGTELQFLFTDIRVGFYQGYPSYGLGVNLFIAQLDAAYYNVESGEYPGQTPQERIQISLNMEFGFDPSFKLLEFGGQKRRLKKRR